MEDFLDNKSTPNHAEEETKSKIHDEIDKETEAFIRTKSLEVFSKLNEMEIAEKDVEITKTRLSGISNTIFKVNIKRINTGERNADANSRDFRIPNIFFKVFGRISVLVNRQLETLIMENLEQLGIGVKIYCTDLKTYRVEEYIEDCTTLKRELMIDDHIYPRIIKAFTIINTFGDFEFYFDYIGNAVKSEMLFKKLKNDKKMNIVNFILNKMKPLGSESFYKFKADFLESIDDVTNSVSNYAINAENIEKIENAITNLDEIVYNLMPDLTLFIINHNDAHPLNILCKPNLQILLCDFEYSGFNIIGFDIANYLVESLFLLEKDVFPFYQHFSKTNCSELKDDKYYNIYLSYFEVFEKDNSHLFKKMGTDFYVDLINQCKTRDYYYKVIGLSSILWFIFAVIYFDYNSIKSQEGLDYFSFCLDRLNIYELYAKNLNL